MAPADWQHDTLVQTLYSGRCWPERSLFFSYSLAQARADVFFSLLFGGRVVCSAATFFDSPVALRVFGELLSHPRCNDIRTRLGWFPLKLNTDNPQRWASPTDYLIARWRDSALKLGIFRESDVPFVAATHLDIPAYKLKAAEYLRDGQFARLRNAFEPFLASFEVPLFDDLVHVTEDEIGAAAESSTIARIPPLLTEDFSEWLRCILAYLAEPNCFSSMDPSIHVSTLSAFSPLAAVKRRTDQLSQEALGASSNYDILELRERTRHFESAVGNTPLMNAFHVNGPDIYGHYLALVTHWIDTDWHTTRHAAYGTSTCLLSSNLEQRELFEIDRHSKVHYLMDAEIDDSLRRTQEAFGELDWDILLDLVSDREWQSLIWKIRDATDSEDVERASDRILDLLARRITDFAFTYVNGHVSIASKRLSTLTNHATAASLITSAFTGPLGALLGAGKSVGAAASTLMPGARWTFQQFTKRRLRTAVVPSIYLD